MTRAYLYRLRSILRRRRRDYMVLAVLVTILGGVAMGSVILGRRTQSSFAAYLARDNASTLTMSTYGVAPGTVADEYLPSVEANIRKLPEIAAVEAWVGCFAWPIGADGTPLPAANNTVNIAASVDGLFFDQDRPAVIQGRMADPDKPDEFVTTAAGARQLGFHVGQVVPFGIFNPAQAEQTGANSNTMKPEARINMRLVGIVEFNNEVVEDDTDRLPTNLVLTPAFTRTQSTYYGTWYGMRLKPGVDDLGALEKRIVALLPPGSAPNFSFESTTEDRVEASLRPESIALAGFGLLAALAAFGLCIPVLSRLTLDGEEDRRTLRALGAPPRLVAADSWVGAVAAVGIGVALAVAVAAALSTLAPLGPVRRVYHPGSVALDWTVIGVGVSVFAGGLGALAVILSVRRTGISGRRVSSPSHPPPSRLAAAAAGAGFPTPVVLGTRFALESGGPRTAVPARSVISSAMLSVTLVVATLTFASGLRNLVSRPSLYGWNWSYELNSQNDIPPAARRALDRDPLVQAWSGYDVVNVVIDGEETPSLGAVDYATVGPPILTGAEITGPGQVVVGPATLARLGKRVGDTVQLGYGSPSTAPLYLPPRPVRIVGTATFPAVAGSSTFAEHPSMGVGVLFSYLTLPPQFRQSIQFPDPTQDGPPVVFVRYRPDVNAKAAEADLDRIVAVADQAFRADPAAAGDTIGWTGVQRPAAIVNYQSTGGTPLVLALGLAAGATGALALSLVASVRRRRRDLAILKTLGFTRAQTTTTLAAQALVIALLGVAVGLPVGIAAGRQLWIAFARSIYAVPVPSVPWSVAVVGGAAIAISLAVAVVPGRLAARTRAAAVLRVE